MAKAAAMRNRVLHESLRDFAEQASFQLEADATGGAEIPFEVVESPGANAPLYCYRPLTADFIRDRLGVLGVLPTYASARRALEGLGGVDAYLRVRGEPRIPDDPGERADAALRSLLSSMFAEASEFEFLGPALLACLCGARERRLREPHADRGPGPGPRAGDRLRRGAARRGPDAGPRRHRDRRAPRGRVVEAGAVAGAQRARRAHGGGRARRPAAPRRGARALPCAC